jgi:hypothetical protein
MNYGCMCGHEQEMHEYNVGRCKSCVCQSFVHGLAGTDESIAYKKVAWVLEQCFMEATRDGCMIMFGNKEHAWWRFLMGLKRGELLHVNTNKIENDGDTK